ncbi:dynactin subunit 3 [Anas acuta]
MGRYREAEGDGGPGRPCGSPPPFKAPSSPPSTPPSASRPQQGGSYRPPLKAEPPSAVQISIERRRPPAGGLRAPKTPKLPPSPPIPIPRHKAAIKARPLPWQRHPPSNAPPWQPGRKRTCQKAEEKAEKMAAGTVALERLRWRLEELEQRLGGGACEPRKVADELVKVQVALSNIAGKRERVKILFKKIEDVIKYLDPQYIDRMAVPDTMKQQFILAEEQVIPYRADLLEQVKNLQPILDSASIQAVPDHAAKLQRLSQIQMQQQDQCKQFSDGVKALLEDYNKTTLLLSKQFVQWNEILMQLEAAKEAKPVAE